MFAINPRQLFLDDSCICIVAVSWFMGLLCCTVLAQFAVGAGHGEHGDVPRRGGAEGLVGHGTVRQ